MLDDDVAAPLGSPAASEFERVGRFRYFTADDRWEWSDAVAQMHGYEPGTVTPTTELILAHKHPDDKTAVAEIIDHVRREGAPFSSRHRIIDTAGKTCLVVVIGERIMNADGKIVGTTGYYVDITDVHDADLQRSISEAVAAIDVSRAAINQAIGIMMWTYGIGADQAFRILAWRSKDTNVKLRVIAERFLSAAAAAPPPAASRDAVDHALLTAHHGVGTADE